MDTIRALQSLGLTGTEARVYAALRRYGPLTGYEAAQHSGVTRANAYTALERLLTRGAVRAIPGARARKFEAATLKDFVEARVRDMRQTGEDVETALRPAPPASRVIAGEGLQALSQAAYTLTHDAVSVVHLALSPEAAMTVGPAIEAVRSREVAARVACLAHCPVPCPVCGPEAHRLEVPWPSGLVLGRDAAEVLIADDLRGDSSYSYAVIRSALLGASIAAAIEGAPMLLQ